MTAQAEPDALTLIALVSSRVCHDAINPVSAVINGFEMLDDPESNQESKDFANTHVRNSAGMASARLRFARLAFGAAGSSSAPMDMADIEAVTRGLLQDSKASLNWVAPRLLLPKNKGKLLLNLVVIANTTIPRGGVMTIGVEGEEPDAVLRIVTTGPTARIPNHVLDLLEGRFSEELDTQVIQPYFTGLVARAAKMAVSITIDGDTVTLLARSATAEPQP